MSLIKMLRAQLGMSGTPTQNFTLTAEAADGSMKLARGNAGATTQDILTVDAAGLVTLNQGKQLTLGTAQNTTSGTAKDFASIPSWVKRITVAFNGVSTSGTSNLLVQIGTGGVPTTTGYAGQTNGGAGSAAFSTGFIVHNNVVAANTAHGFITLTHMGGNIWAMVGAVVSQTATNTGYGTAGSVSLSGVLDNIRVTTANGTDTFDAGSINIMYEG